MTHSFKILDTATIRRLIQEAVKREISPGLYIAAYKAGLVQ